MSSSNSTVTTLDDASKQPDAPVKKAATVVKGANASPELSGKRVTVTINAAEGDGGNDAIFVGHNGFAYQIPRGVPVDLPVEVLQILKDAKTTISHTGEGGKLVERTVQRYTWQVEA